MEKKYKVKVTYLYTDIVEVEANSCLEAMDMAPDLAEEGFECLYDCEILAEEDIDD
jgi:hypothetical protein